MQCPSNKAHQYLYNERWLPGTSNSSMGHSPHGGEGLSEGHGAGGEGHGGHSLGQGLLVIRGQVEWGHGREGQVGQGRGVRAGEQVGGGGHDGHSGGVGEGEGEGVSLRQPVGIQRSKHRWHVCRYKPILCSLMLCKHNI